MVSPAEPKTVEASKSDFAFDTLFDDDKDIFADLFAPDSSKAVDSKRDSEEEEEDIFAALFGDDSTDAREEILGSEEQETEEFNIFEFFEEQETMDAKISIIEKMEIFGDMIIEITLEDLALYNRNMIRRG